MISADVSFGKPSHSERVSLHSNSKTNSQKKNCNKQTYFGLLRYGFENKFNSIFIVMKISQMAHYLNSDNYQYELTDGNSNNPFTYRNTFL